MSELEKALAAVGESAPKRPQPIDRPWSDARNRPICSKCNGWGWYNETGTEYDSCGYPVPYCMKTKCAACSGTGKEQPR